MFSRYRISIANPADLIGTTLSRYHASKLNGLITR